MQAQYTLCCDDATGGVVDDLIVYHGTVDDMHLVPNAANTAEVVRRFHFERTSNEPIPPLPSITVRPTKPLDVILHAR